jgi:hypothetical protein
LQRWRRFLSQIFSQIVGNFVANLCDDVNFDYLDESFVCWFGKKNFRLVREAGREFVATFRGDIRREKLIIIKFWIIICHKLNFILDFIYYFILFFYLTLFSKTILVSCYFLNKYIYIYNLSLNFSNEWDFELSLTFCLPNQECKKINKLVKQNDI